MIKTIRIFLLIYLFSQSASGQIGILRHAGETEAAFSPESWMSPTRIPANEGAIQTIDLILEANETVPNLGIQAPAYRGGLSPSLSLTDDSSIVSPGSDDGHSSKKTKTTGTSD